MSRVTITIGRPDSPRPVMRRIGRTLLVLCVVGVLFQALFPFDFLSDPSSFSRQVSRRLVRSTTIEGNEADWWINVLFFLPLGFALASIFKRQPKRWIYQLGAAAIVGPVLSGVVELAQVFLPGREASLGDVAANSIGCLVGSAAYLGVGDMVLEPIARGLRRAEGMLTERNALLVSTIYAALIIAAPLLIPRPGDISNWNGGFRLYVGNDKPNRPWSGLVREVDFVDRATTPLEAEQLPSLDRRLKQVYGSSLIASYSLLGEGSFLDSIGHAPPLNWVGHGVVAGEISPALVGTEQFLQSAEPVGAVIGPLIRAGRFSVLVRASSSLPDQDGPCGIASIENPAWGETNVEIAQDRSNLVVRVRSKLTGQYATKPEMEIRGVFADTMMHNIILSFDGARIAVFVDGVERGSVRFSSEAAVIWTLYPRGIFRLNLESPIDWIYSVLYRVLTLTPLGMLIGLCTRLGTGEPRREKMFTAGAIVGAVMLFEGVLAMIDPGGFHFVEPVMSLVICALATAAVTRRWKLRRG